VRFDAKDFAMKRLTALILAAACIAGAAFAQQGGAPMVFVPEFAAQPSQADYISNYPPRALRENVSGIAVLCCDPREDRGLDCAVSSEWPEARGFGEASLRATQAYRLTPPSHADLVARPGVKVRLSVRWVGPVPDEAAIATLRRLDGETAFACLPPLESTQ